MHACTHIRIYIYTPSTGCNKRGLWCTGGLPVPTAYGNGVYTGLPAGDKGGAME